MYGCGAKKDEISGLAGDNQTIRNAEDGVELGTLLAVASVQLVKCNNSRWCMRDREAYRYRYHCHRYMALLSLQRNYVPPTSITLFLGLALFHYNNNCLAISSIVSMF